MKKQILTIAIAVSSLQFFAQDVKIRESNENFSNGGHNALSVTLYVTDVNMVEKEWKSQMKDFGYDKSSEKSNEYFFDNVIMKQLGNNTLDVFSKVTEQKAEKTVTLTAAFDLGGAYLNSSEHKDKFEYVKKVMHDFAVKITKEALDDQIKAAGKVLSNIQDKQAGLEKDNKGLADDITNYNQKIKKANEQIEQNKKDIETKKGEVTAQQKVVDGIKAKKESVK
jgi:flagellar motility protein MotE (MotC chaperone)